MRIKQKGMYTKTPQGKPHHLADFLETPPGGHCELTRSGLQLNEWGKNHNCKCLKNTYGEVAVKSKEKYLGNLAQNLSILKK